MYNTFVERSAKRYAVRPSEVTLGGEKVFDLL